MAVTCTYSKAEDQFRKLMGILSALFLIGAVLFIFAPDGVVRVINFVAKISPTTRAPIVSLISVDKYNDVFYQGVNMPVGARLPSHGMYVALAVAFMVLVTVMSGLIFYDQRKYSQLAWLLIIGKAASGLTGLGYYLWSYHYLANLMVPITDLPIALVMLIFYLRAKGSAPAVTA